eukprot:scaffold7849_cov457-Prasinococcus_capsulatus_cf.AAC.12
MTSVSRRLSPSVNTFPDAAASMPGADTVKVGVPWHIREQKSLAFAALTQQITSGRCPQTGHRKVGVLWLYEVLAVSRPDGLCRALSLLARASMHCESCRGALLHAAATSEVASRPPIFSRGRACDLVRVQIAGNGQGDKIKALHVSAAIIISYDSRRGRRPARNPRHLMMHRGAQHYCTACGLVQCTRLSLTLGGSLAKSLATSAEPRQTQLQP